VPLVDKVGWFDEILASQLHAIRIFDKEVHLVLAWIHNDPYSNHSNPPCHPGPSLTLLRDLASLLLLSALLQSSALCHWVHHPYYGANQRYHPYSTACLLV
jgi:hypothetical protein